MDSSVADTTVTQPAKMNEPVESNHVESRDVIDDVRQVETRSKRRNPGHYYDMSAEKFLIIFNHSKYEATKYNAFEELPERNGTQQDVEALKAVFGKFGFRPLTYNDYKRDQIISIVNNISQQDHSRTSCLAFAILTHGSRGGQLNSADRPYYLKDITSLLEHGHSTLVNKPKLFFIQACRGPLTDSGRKVQYDGVDDNTILLPSHSNFLFMYSTVEDHISWRRKGGSWLIQELCKILNDHHQDLDLLHMITLTIENVAYEYSSNTPDETTHNKKQTPEARFTLTKLVRFSSADQISNV